MIIYNIKGRGEFYKNYIFYNFIRNEMLSLEFEFLFYYFYVIYKIYI